MVLWFIKVCRNAHTIIEEKVNHMSADNTLEKALKMHELWNGKIETTAKSHVKSREDLAVAYTPGVAEPCKVIAKDKEAAR